MAYPYYGYTQPQMQMYANQYQTNGLVWVQGENGAKAYLVAPNTTVLLMDSETNHFYLKSSDASGMPRPLRRFTYTEDALEAPNSVLKADETNSTSYATKDEIKALQSEIEDIKKHFENKEADGREQFNF